ncbi:SDR family oxidoreductase [Chloroflexi bacterium TSY]|nr:SDR family oxidoreductase [Chloroflexi bacterium TSY]
MTGQFEGKVALVTGSGSGIGRASALAFAKEGASIVVADIVTAGGEETVQMITEAGGEAIFVRADVSQAAEVEALLHRIVESYGRLDYAHNNAGIESIRIPTVEHTEETWDSIINVNLKGVWLCMKYEIPQMLKHGGGAIVNTSSVAGLAGYAGVAAYAASKHGVNGLTKVAAIEYAQAGVRVNAVCPGAIRTPMIQRALDERPEMADGIAAMHPLGRMGEPEEIAQAVVWLCSDAASFVTGLPMSVDGGIVAQ